MNEPGSGPLVRAGGGVVRRPGPHGAWDYAVVHRPRYDDWSLPKGKADPGESDEDAAVREVEEETGVRCRLGPELSADELRGPPGPAQGGAVLAHGAGRGWGRAGNLSAE